MIHLKSPGALTWGQGLVSSVAIVFGGGILAATVLCCNPVPAYANSQSIQQVTYQDGIPEEIRPYFDQVGAEFNICPELLEAIAYRESRFVPKAKNKNHIGIMQVNVKIHKKRIEKYGWTEADMYDPYKNITVAADYLYELYEKYGDDNPIILNIYSGNSKANAYYKEYGFLSEYCKDVLTRSEEYETLHGKK